MKRIAISFFCLALLGCASASPKKAVQTPQSPVVEKTAPTPEPLPINQPPTPEEENIVKVKIETTLGVIEADLDAASAPKTVENFVTLAKKGFYDGIVFHRVIPGFMIQTGDPTGTGMGGPGYQFNDEFSPKLRHDKPGVLSMANSGLNTNGSQFFITDAPTPWLDDHHSVFGHVTKGMDVVSQIARVNRNAQDKPLSPIKMDKVVIVQK